MISLILSFLQCLSVNALDVYPSQQCPPSSYVTFAGGQVQCVPYPFGPPNICPTCQVGPNYPQQQFPSIQPYPFPPNFQFFNPYPTPWWGNYGQNRYSNFHYPGLWNYPGFRGNEYPGQGPIMALKPNIYFSEDYPPGPVTIELIPKNGALILASSPAYREPLKGEVKKGQFEQGPALYPYVFYDFRMRKEDIQFKEGACFKHQEMMSILLSYLKKHHFDQRERDDFQEHWSQKLPAHAYYCLYPQGDTQLSQSLEVKITPSPKRFRRILFLMTVFKGPPHETESSIPLPLKTWDQTPLPLEKGEVREWGVAFLTEDSQRP